MEKHFINFSLYFVMEILRKVFPNSRKYIYHKSIKTVNIKKNTLGNSLAVQGLGLHLSTAGGTDLIPRHGTKILRPNKCQ